MRKWEFVGEMGVSMRKWEFVGEIGVSRRKLWELHPVVGLLIMWIKY